MLIRQRFIKLGKVDYLEHGRADCPAQLEVTLTEHDDGRTVFSMSASVWNHIRTDIYMGGQCCEEVVALAVRSKRSINTRTARALIPIWKRWHLNGMRAGVPEQEEAIRKFRATFPEWRYNYGDACHILSVLHLYEVDGVKYGHKWHYEPIPDDVLRTIKSLCWPMASDEPKGE